MIMIFSKELTENPWKLGRTLGNPEFNWNRKWNLNIWLWTSKINHHKSHFELRCNFYGELEIPYSILFMEPWWQISSKVWMTQSKKSAIDALWFLNLGYGCPTLMLRNRFSKKIRNTIFCWYYRWLWYRNMKVNFWFWQSII